MATSLLVADPSIGGPTFLVGTGGVDSTGAAAYYSQRAEINGANSPWALIQWHMNHYISPTALTSIPSSFTDSVYGAPHYVWENSDDTASLAAYTAADGSWVYGLESHNGWDGANDGGANLSLSVPLASPITMNNTVNYSVDLRITDAAVSGNGAAFLNTGFTINFHDPTGASPDIGLFLQIPITHSEGQAASNYYSMSTNSNGSITAIAQGLLAGAADPFLAFSASNQTVDVTYSSINLYLQQAISKLGLTATASNLADWTLGSVYIGTEVGTTDGNPYSGNAEIGLQVSHLLLSTTTNGTTFYPAATVASTPVVTQTATPAVTTSTSTTATTVVSAPVVSSTPATPVVVAPVVVVPNTSPVFSGSADQYTITASNNQFVVTDQVAGRDGSRTLLSGATPSFSDGTVSLDPTGQIAHIVRFYQATFDRVPSMAEVQSQLASKATDITLATSFLSSPEFLAKGQSGGQFMTAIFNNAFGTAPPAAYIQQIGATMNNPTVEATFLLGVVDSSQAMPDAPAYTGTATDANTVKVEAMYEIAQDRQGTSAEVNNYTAMIANGTTLTAIAQGFVAAPAYGLSGMSNSAFITTLFQNMRGAPPDSSTLQSWTANLAGGLSRVDALVAIASSSEAASLVTAGTNQGWALTH
jgi:hypothetical protein